MQGTVRIVLRRRLRFHGWYSEVPFLKGLRHEGVIDVSKSSTPEAVLEKRSGTNARDQTIQRRQKYS